MRIVYWLFVVSAALFVSGIGFIVAGARTTHRVAPAEAPALTPVASVKQIMNGIVQPAANVVFGSVGTIISAAGIVEKAPKTDEEWAAVGSSAVALVESANLLVMGDRAVDREDWVKMSRALAEAGMTALKATEAKSTDGVLSAGAAVNESCDNCHRKYQRE
ncbi:MAG: hypothetical protein EHM89_06550 [Acidobacteria bacterium]|nr:MAG: hypothetical protein EHM89_06550 [Acidobacteriota bacterium]